MLNVFSALQVEDSNADYMIRGFKHYVYVGNATMNIISGGIGFDHVKFTIQSIGGNTIRSSVHFYGENFNSIDEEEQGAMTF